VSRARVNSTLQRGLGEKHDIDELGDCVVHEAWARCHPDGCQDVGLVPDRSRLGGADFVDQQLDERGRVDVGDHCRCSATRSLTEPDERSGTGRWRSFEVGGRWAVVGRPSPLGSVVSRAQVARDD
jgi:hypothetical protein